MFTARALDPAISEQEASKELFSYSPSKQASINFRSFSTFARTSFAVWGFHNSAAS